MIARQSIADIDADPGTEVLDTLARFTKADAGSKTMKWVECGAWLQPGECIFVAQHPEEMEGK